MRIQNLNYLIKNHGYDKPFYFFDNLLNGYIYKVIMIPDEMPKDGYIMIEILDVIETFYTAMCAHHYGSLNPDHEKGDISGLNSQGITSGEYVYSTFEDALTRMPKVYTNNIESDLKIRYRKELRPQMRKILEDLKTPVTQLIALDSI